jgi:LytS/YehU family sensor histidine kinase
MGATYLVLYVFLPKYLIEEKNYGKFIFFFCLNFILTNILDRFIISTDLIDRILKDTGLTFTFFNEIPIFRNSFLLLSIMGLAFGIRFFKLFLKEERRKHQLQEEHLATKLAFLKTQINPHFLFNALNNLYSMAIQEKQEEIAQGLENLSGIMHYLTYESSAEMVSLEKEIKLLQDYMEIQHLRIGVTDNTLISFNIEGEVRGKKIAPVILLPLTENAFKHGIQPEHKCLVKIRLIMEGNRLIFNIKNTFFPKTKALITEKGIGIENVKKRLLLTYPNRHEFKHEIKEDYFYTTLQLDIGKKHK